jgi:putative hydrolase of the HAD superfamily
MKGTISFDLDGVLIQNPFGKGIIPHVRAHIRQGTALRELEPLEAERQIDAAVREAWVSHMARGDLVAAYDWDAIYNGVSEQFGGEPVPAVAELVVQYAAQEGMIALLPGAKAGLAQLQEAGFRLVAATNGYHAYQWPVLEALGIAHYFSAALTPDVVGYAKPDPRFLASLTDLRAHVGDTLMHDVLVANLSGVAAVWLEAELPDAVRALPLSKRTGAAAFREHHHEVWANAPFRRYHPEGTLEACWPDVAVTDVEEAAVYLLGRLELRECSVQNVR